MQFPAFEKCLPDRRHFLGITGAKFTGRYEHRDLGGGIGHNLPQEAPTAFAQTVLDVGPG